MAKGKSKTRPQSTSLLSAPADVTSTSTSNVVSSFSPDGRLFAFLTQAIDRHRLRIYTSAEGSGAGSDASLLVDYVLPEARCECISWGKLPGSSKGHKDDETSKRRRKSKGDLFSWDVNGSSSSGSSSQVVLALGLSTGAIHLFSPTQGRVIRILHDETISASSAASSSITSVDFDSDLGLVVGCAADGQIRTWNLTESLADKANAPVDRIRPDASTPVRTLAFLSTRKLAVAHHSIQVLSGPDRKKGALASFTGHASNITHLVSIPGDAPRFVSAADGDRIVNVWGMPPQGQKEARPIATLALDSTVRQLTVYPSSSVDAVLVVVTSTGALRLYDIPASLGEQASNGSAAGARPRKSAAGVSTLRKLSEIRLLARKDDQESFPILDASFSSIEQGTLSIARVIKGAKVSLLTTLCKDPMTGTFLPQVDVLRQPGTANLANFDDGSQTIQGGGAQAMQKYAEPEVSSSASRKRAAQGSSVISGNGMLAEAGASTTADDQANLDANIEDLEGPTLGSRLKGLDSRRVNGTSKPSHGSDDEDEEDRDSDEDDDAELQRRAPLPQGSLSLAQTLVQALHSSDSSLLSSCLAHSDPNVIRQTVRRISGPLAVRLLENCVDRMSAGGKKSKGALAASNSRGIIEWVRATLTAHTSYLMSLPDLVHRLAQLHSMLSHRLSSHERLLLLHGRLELVLSQIEMRTAYAAEQRVAQGTAKSISGVKTKGRGTAAAAPAAAEKRKERRWVEASEDEDEDEDEDMDEDDVAEGDEVDVAREEGSDDGNDGEIQDIGLGMGDETGVTSLDSADEEEEEEEDEDEDDDEEMDDAEEEDESELEEDSDEDEEDEEDSDDERSSGLKAKSKGLVDDEAEESDDDDEDSEEEEG